MVDYPGNANSGLHRWFPSFLSSSDLPGGGASTRVPGSPRSLQVHGLLSAFETLGGRKQATTASGCGREPPHLAARMVGRFGARDMRWFDIDR